MPSPDLLSLIVIEVTKVSITAFVDGVHHTTSIIDALVVLILELPTVIGFPEQRLHVCSVV